MNNNVIEQAADQLGLNLEDAFSRIQLDALTLLVREVLSLEESKKTSKVETWEPKGGEWFFTHYGDLVEAADSFESCRLFGSEFKTKEEAERASKDIKRRLWLTHLAKELNDGWVADWEDVTQSKSCLYYDTIEKSWRDLKNLAQDTQAIYFSKPAIKRLIEMLNSGEVVLP